MSRTACILFAALLAPCFLSCSTLPEHRKLAIGSASRTGALSGQPSGFSKAEFTELLLALRPLFEESGFKCYDDGAHGGFSIIEGPLHYAWYGLVGEGGSGTWLNCTIKATRKGLRLEIQEYEDQRGSGKFTTTKIEREAISQVVQRIRDFLRSDYPNVTFELVAQNT